MIDKSSGAALRVARYLLLGAYLDSLRVYSSSLELRFARLNEQERPNEVWIAFTSGIRVEAPSLHSSPAVDALHDKRGAALYVLCQMIGEEVSSVEIAGSGALLFHLGSCCVQLHLDEVNTEEVWSITSDSPDPNHKHQWSVTLDEFGQVAVHVPSSSDETS